jgi:plastocyanin
VHRPSIFALAGVALVLAGCGNSSTSSSSTPASTPATPSTASSAAATSTTAFLAPLTTVSKLASTVPANGDVNPYGIVLIPTSVGKLTAGNLLVSNFNDKANNQGTGTTIAQISTAGKTSLFAQINPSALPGSCPGGVGLTTALSVLPGGYVVVGSLPTTNGKSATAQLGCLIVLDSNGKPVSTIAGSQIAGPWDMTAVTQSNETTLFVSNVLDGGAAKALHKTANNSTVLRIRLQSGVGQPPKVISQQVIANEIPWRDDPAALVIGPTGVALASNGTLYLADTLQNRITAIPQAMTRTTPAKGGGTTISEGGHLKQPLGLALAPNGDILTTNAGDGNMVETTPAGKQVEVRTADKETGEGSLFGLVVHKGVIYYVDDGDNTLRLLHTASLTPASATATHTTSSSASSSTTASTPASAPTKSSSSSSSTTASAGGASSAAEALSLEANPEGQLKYNKTSLTANAGKVSIDFSNMSSLDHNMTIASASGAVIGATPTFQGGSKTLTLNLKPGAYKFYCTVPGHRMAGMEGTLTVK